MLTLVPRVLDPKGNGAQSCGEWVTARAKDALSAETVWVLGFLSGLAAGEGVAFNYDHFTRRATMKDDALFKHPVGTIIVVIATMLGLVLLLAAANATG